MRLKGSQEQGKKQEWQEEKERKVQVEREGRKG